MAGDLTFMSYNRGAVGGGQTNYVNQPNGAALSTVTPAINTMIAAPFPVFEPLWVNELAFEVTTLGAASFTRIGIYSNKGAGQLYPANLVVDGGSQDTNTTGLKQTTYTGNGVIKLDVGIYWMAYVTSIVAPVVRAVAAIETWPLLGWSEAAPPVYRTSVTFAFTFAAFPANFPTTTPAYASAAIPVILMQSAAPS